MALRCNHYYMSTETSSPGSGSAEETLRAWFTGRLPDSWFTGPPAVTVDREETRDHRIEIAREAEHKFGRKVSWGVEVGGSRVMFTTFSVPVMTRLRQSERQVLDTLVDGGVARSRSDALAWCVRLVGANSVTWLADMRAALRKVEQVRAEGPES